MYKHARLRAIHLSLAPSISFAYSIHKAGGQRSLLYIRSASSNSERHQSHPTTVPPYNNGMKRTMKDNNERWLSENRLSPRKLGKGLLLKGRQPDRAIHCYCWLATGVARKGQALFVWERVRHVCSGLQGPAWIVFAFSLAL